MHYALRDVGFVVALIWIAAVAFGMASAIFFATTSLGVGLLNAQSCQDGTGNDCLSFSVQSQRQVIFKTRLFARAAAHVTLCIFRFLALGWMPLRQSVSPERSLFVLYYRSSCS